MTRKTSLAERLTSILASAAARSRAGMAAGSLPYSISSTASLRIASSGCWRYADQDFGWQTFPTLKAFDQGQENVLRLFIVKGDAHRIKYGIFTVMAFVGQSTSQARQYQQSSYFMCDLPVAGAMARQSTGQDSTQI